MLEFLFNKVVDLKAKFLKCLRRPFFTEQL